MVKAKRDAILEIAYLDRNNPKHQRALLDVIIEICKLMVEEDYGKGQGGQEFLRNYKLDKLAILNEQERERACGQRPTSLRLNSDPTILRTEGYVRGVSFVVYYQFPIYFFCYLIRI
jgi:hypothetical protein